MKQLLRKQVRGTVNGGNSTLWEHLTKERFDKKESLLKEELMEASVK